MALPNRSRIEDIEDLIVDGDEMHLSSGLSSEEMNLHDREHLGTAAEFENDDEYSLDIMNNPMIMLISSIMAESGQTGNLPSSMTDIHALATANLISQTQEAIMQEYNIDMTSPDYFPAEFTQIEPVMPNETNTDNTNIDVDCKKSSSLTLIDTIKQPLDHDKTEGSEGKDTTKEPVETLNTLELNGKPDKVVLDEVSNEPKESYQITDQTFRSPSLRVEHPMKLVPVKLDELQAVFSENAKSFTPGLSGHIRVSVCDKETALSESGHIRVSVCDKETALNEAGNALQLETTTTDKCSVPGNFSECENSRKHLSKDKIKGIQVIGESGEQTVCEQCGKTLRNRKALHNHQACHAPLCCPIPHCQRTFNYPSHYEYHLLTHREARRFICECGKAFYTRQQLQVHQRTHQSDKPFTCSLCDKPFTTAGNLKNHQRLHTGEKPFICTVTDCAKSFAETSSLKKHLLTHTGDKPYKCPICNKGFTQTSSRIYHMKHKHSKLPEYSSTVTPPVTSPIR